jgi:cell division protein FtsQ
MKRRRTRIALICAVLALPLLGGGWLWLRQSSFVAVEHVRITGTSGPQAGAIEATLTRTAKGMSTLDVSRAALMEALARHPTVSSLRLQASFPHSLEIFVTERPAVAVLVVDGAKTAISAGGVVLGGGLVSSSLPQVGDDVTPAVGERLRNPLVLAALSVMGAAPPVLDGLAKTVYEGPHGLTVLMRNGLQVYFGDASRAHAKWLSLARVLADKSSAGASYVDVRLPERPAAGFPEDGSRTGAEATVAAAPAGHESGESTVSALAAGLSADSPESKSSSTETKTAPSDEQAQTGSEQDGTGGTTTATPTGTGEVTQSEPSSGATAGATAAPTEETVTEAK